MFGFGNNSFLGIDIGSSAIKMVELRIENNKPTLSNYAWMKIGAPDSGGSFFGSEGAYLEYARRMIKEAGIKSKNAYISIPAFGGLITLIEFPEMAEKELEQAIRFEAHKYIPTSLDDVVLSWDIVAKMKNSKKLLNSTDHGKKEVDLEKIQVLLVAAPKKKVAKYENVINQLGISLKTIEIESFSLVRSLVGNDQGNFVIVDIGSRVCNIVLVEKGIIKVNRNIDAGGSEITRAIATAMSLTIARAEKMKLSGKDFLASDSSLKISTLEMITGEIKRVLASYYKDQDISKIDSVILSGGTAELTSVEKYFSDALGIKTVIGNPLGRIEYDQKLEPILGSVKGQLSVAIGLALKGAEDYLRK